MTSSGLANLRLGTAPDSWGVWFPDHPQQVPWSQFLDEASAAGYEWIELGPYGYLPTDQEQLRDELGKRGLQLSGGTVAAGLHHGPDALSAAVAECRVVASLISALGAEHLVFLPECYRDLEGSETQARELTSEQWQQLVSGMSKLGKTMTEEFGISINFHPHADSHVGQQSAVERLLHDTDAESVSLCLDTGHISYCGGDNLDLIRRYPERIGYVHLKAVDPQVVAKVVADDLCFAEAVKLGAMVEPPNGIPAMPQLLDELEALGIDLFTIVEQDLFPCRPEIPLPIATRTKGYLSSCGLGQGQRR